MSAADRMRKMRARRREGVRVARNVEVTTRVLDALVACGLTTEIEARDRDALGDVVTDFLDTWARGTLQSPNRYAVTPGSRSRGHVDSSSAFSKQAKDGNDAAEKRP